MSILEKNTGRLREQDKGHWMDNFCVVDSDLNPALLYVTVIKLL